MMATPLLVVDAVCWIEGTWYTLHPRPWLFYQWHCVASGFRNYYQMRGEGINEVG